MAGNSKPYASGLMRQGAGAKQIDLESIAIVALWVGAVVVVLI